MDQVTIREAFNKHKKIEIEYIRVVKCANCGNLTDVYVPEKNFSGSMKQFATYSRKFFNVNLDTIVEEDPLEPGTYYYEELDLDAEEDVFCEECEDFDEDDFLFF